MKKYFISYSYINENGISRFGNCTVNIKENKIILRDIERELNKRDTVNDSIILFFTELKKEENLEKKHGK